MRMKKTILVELMILVMLLQGCSLTKNSGIETDSNLNDVASLKNENEVLKERNNELSAKVTLLENKTKDIEELQEKVSVLSSERNQLLSSADEDEVAGSASLLTPSLLLDYAYAVLT